MGLVNFQLLNITQVTNYWGYNLQQIWAKPSKIGKKGHRPTPVILGTSGMKLRAKCLGTVDGPKIGVSVAISNLKSMDWFQAKSESMYFPLKCTGFRFQF